MKFLKNNNFINFEKIDGYNKPFNKIDSGREGGKTSYAEYVKTFKNLLHGRGSVVYLKRYENDISNISIKAMETRINIFLDEPCKFVDISGITTGIVSTKIEYKKKRLPGTVSFIWLGRIQKLKNVCIENVRYIIIDEYNINPKLEKYQAEEFNKVIEFYKTVSRYTKYKIRCYFLGNTYSRYSPFTDYFNVPYNEIKANKIIVGPNWTYWNFQFSDERAKELEENDPVYKYDEDYRKFALKGQYIFDDNKKNIIPEMPIYFKLIYYIYTNNTFLGVFYGSNDNFEYYIKSFNKPLKNNKHNIYCFNNIDMGDNLNFILFNEKYETHLTGLINAMRFNHVRYDSPGSFYKLDLIFSNYKKNF